MLFISQSLSSRGHDKMNRSFTETTLSFEIEWLWEQQYIYSGIWTHVPHVLLISSSQLRHHIDPDGLQEYIHMIQWLSGQLHLCYREAHLQILNIRSTPRTWGLHWVANDLCLISMRSREIIPQPLVTMCCFVRKERPQPTCAMLLSSVRLFLPECVLAFIFCIQPTYKKLT